MPEPIKRDQRYVPGLDGLRAIAVLAVIAYHVGFAAAPGGLLGVGVFFTLSGYLITDLLLSQVRRGGIRLKPFWYARARRLLPGLLVMLIVVMAWVTVLGPHQPADFRTAAETGIFYVNNWWLIFHHVSYFAHFAAPSPLNHLWSLSVEEQFYLLWPFMLLLGLRFVPEAGSTRLQLVAITMALAVASAILMAVMYHPGLDPSRVYYGTDTRAQEILIGAAFAMVWPSRRLSRNITEQARRVIDRAGALGLGVIALMFWRSGEYSHCLYRGGFLLLSLATVLVLAALTHPASRLGPIVGCPPLRWIGERSYGIYLWHFPIIVLTTPARAHGPDLVRALFQIAAIFSVAALSWRFVENPIRHGALESWRDRAREGRWRLEVATRQSRAALAGVALVLVAALAGLAGVGSVPSSASQVGNVNVAKTVTVKRVDFRAKAASCRSVVHVGDSTSEGLISADYLPHPRQRISAQYARVGATTQHFEISGARSIYERFEGKPNAYDVAAKWKKRRFHGCWVFALGTNEAANVAAGSKYTFDQRIDRMMRVSRGQRVLWVDVRSLLSSGPYSASSMLQWDAALLRACDQYPNMRIYDWASDVQDSWFIADGIHFTTAGYAARSRFIADALREAFPAGRRPLATNSTNCVLHPEAGARSPAGSPARSQVVASAAADPSQ